MKDPQVENQFRLQHILHAIHTIERFVKDSNSQHFTETPMLHDAVLFQFTVIGEAINHVENQLLQRYDYPWYKVRSFRNLIAHEYFNVKLTAVWQIIESDLPRLKDTISQILDTEFRYQ